MAGEAVNNRIFAKTHFRVGDLVTTTWEGGNQMHESYDGPKPENPTFRFNRHDIGLVLEINRNLNSPAIRVAVGDRVGWTNAAFYEVLK